jgi:hypothetical protein
MWKDGSHFIVDVEDEEVVTKLADAPAAISSESELAKLPD